MKLSSTVTDTKTIGEYLKGAINAPSISNLNHGGSYVRYPPGGGHDVAGDVTRKIDTITLYGIPYKNAAKLSSDPIDEYNQDLLIKASGSEEDINSGYHFYVRRDGSLVNKTPMDVTNGLVITNLNKADTLWGLGADQSGRHNLGDGNVRADLKYILETSADLTGVTVHGSSGYRPPSANPSGRHNGRAYDVALKVNGRALSVMNPEDYAIIKTYTFNFVRVAAQVVGPGKACAGIANPAYAPRLYMGGTVFHYDITGNFPYWGGSGSTGSVPAAAWHVEMLKNRDKVDEKSLLKDELSIAIIGKITPEQMKTLRQFIRELKSKIPTIKYVKLGDPAPEGLDSSNLFGLNEIANPTPTVIAGRPY